MDIKRSDLRSVSNGPDNYFTGEVTIEPLISANDSHTLASALVTFAPGARTAWHTHPRGQMIYITQGHGWVQRVGGPKEVINPGDAVWFAPGEKHWHGAQPNATMVHIAVQEIVNGSPVDWLELVTEEEYLGG